MVTKEQGFCICCGNLIPYNVNKVFCKKCIKNKQVITQILEGKFCHSCKSANSRISNIEPRCRECKPFNSDDNLIDDYYIEQVNKYKSLSFSERKSIKPKWHNPNLPIIEIDKLHLNEWGFNLSNIFENEPKDVRRILNFLRAWEKGFSVEVPLLDVKTERIRDGRHRIMALLYLQEKTTPIKF